MSKKGIKSTKLSKNSTTDEAFMNVIQATTI